MDDRAVLGNHTIDETEPSGDTTQVVQASAGHEHHRIPQTARSRDTVDHGWIQPVIAGERAVVVQREN